jgi:hypothetical protein
MLAASSIVPFALSRLVQLIHQAGQRDFNRWKEHDAYSKALDRLLRDLRIEKVQAVGEEAL